MFKATVRSRPSKRLSKDNYFLTVQRQAIRSSVSADICQRGHELRNQNSLDLLIYKSEVIVL